MVERLISNYSEVVENVRRFNDNLSLNQQLQQQLPYFRSWYYIPELDAAGPSKFIGYKAMTVERYIGVCGKELDGRWTEPELKAWFGILENSTPEHKYVASIVETLIQQYRKRINRVARFNAPRGWILNRLTPQTSPIVDVFWQAYKTLAIADQERLARRITEDLQGHENKNSVEKRSNLAKI